MPRPRKPDGGEPKSRSRSGCWSCKARKVKCTEERPNCSRCVKGGYQCDYGIRLNWDGRRSKRPQLKAVPLGSGMLAQGDAVDDADDNDGPASGDDSAGAPLAHAAAAPSLSSGQRMHPPSQRQMQFQLDFAASPPQLPPSASSSASASATATTAATTSAFSSVTFQSGMPPASQMPAAGPHGSHGMAGQFQVLTPVTVVTVAPTSLPGPAQAQRVGQQPAKVAEPPSLGHAFAPVPVPVPSSARYPAADGPQIPFSATAMAAAENARRSLDTTDTTDRQPAKRLRVDSDASERDFAWTVPLSPTTGSSSLSGSLSATSPRQFVFPTPALGAKAAAADEWSSPRLSDDGHSRASPRVGSGGGGGGGGGGGLFPHQAVSDFRRLSVSSLLSGPVDASSNAATPPSASTPPIPHAPPLLPQAGDAHPAPSLQPKAGEDAAKVPDPYQRSSCYYGIDGGFQDLDLGKNDDANALSGLGSGPAPSRGYAPDRGAAREPPGYYSKPVAVRIPRSLGPLPRKLTENPMNILYFHHFLNNTARVLVPHDDPQSNPFRTILPQMAINNDNLLSLLLAYSASHRARMLDQTEPAMRIALWVQDIFPALRQALDDQKQKISNANVATAIMLASLAIVSPTAFGYNIPWQRHLMLARELIATRPEGLRVDHHSSLEGQVCSFLWSWFAYLDVLGGLSGGPTDASPAWILDYKVYDPQDDDEIDCIMGFTTRCAYILSQIAELVRRCEPARLRAMREDAEGWVPGLPIEMSVESLEVDVRDSMAQTPRPCAHLHRSGDVVRWDRQEMEATNEAYHWAALVHLQRRVLGKPTAHADVQEPVRQIVRCVDRVHWGGTAENCLLLPLFTAGCECLEEGARKKLLRRMQSMEGTGMMQVTRARALMQRAWATGKPWETLLTTEFIG